MSGSSWSVVKPRGNKNCHIEKKKKKKKKGLLYPLGQFCKGPARYICENSIMLFVIVVALKLNKVEPGLNKNQPNLCSFVGPTKPKGEDPYTSHLITTDNIALLFFHSLIILVLFYYTTKLLPTIPSTTTLDSIYY